MVTYRYKLYESLVYSHPLIVLCIQIIDLRTEESSFLNSKKIPELKTNRNETSN